MQKIVIQREKRHKRLRMRIKGSNLRPRLSVYRSHKNIYAQVVNDTENKTLLFLSTQDKELKQKINSGGNIKAAECLGEILAKKAKEKGITKLTFDRGAYAYHGRIKALAESARKAGLEF